MKRRDFIKGISKSSSAVWLSSQSMSSKISGIFPYEYPQPATLQEALTKEGEIAVRIDVRSAKEKFISLYQGNLIVNGAKLIRKKLFFLEAGEDDFPPNLKNIHSRNRSMQGDIICLWLKDANEETSISLQGQDDTFAFTLVDLLKKSEVVHEVGDTKITANLLLDKEIGTISLDQVGGKSHLEEDFSFVIMADPQGGDPREEGNWPTRMKIHNAWIEESIERINELNPQPQFTLVLGDVVDSQGEMANFVQMNAFLETIKCPVLLSVGNHETRYQSVFTPGYNMSAFDNYFSAQEALNGMQFMLYSFDLGEWHFIVWPDPLRANFWETHPHYFDWLERDLEKNKDRPTFFFQHVPSHPIGIDPLITYAESTAVKRLLLDILSQHGNVKFIFSGHVHIPVKSSFKTAVNYRGMKMINLPAAGYRPRAFGEEDFAGGPCQGVAVVNVKGKEAEIRYKTVTEEEYVYPATLPLFDEDKYALWLKAKWQLPAHQQLINGSFEQGEQAWVPRYVYQEDTNPSHICEIRELNDRPGFHALYLHAHKRAYDIPGQDRLPQTINRVAQAVSWKDKQQPELSLKYLIEGQQSDLEGWCGAYVWVEAFNGSNRCMSLVYWTGTAYTSLSTKEERELSDDIHLALDSSPDRWHQARLHLAKDFETHSGIEFTSLQADRLVINLGVWTINDGGPYPYSIYLDDLDLKAATSSAWVSQAGNKQVDKKPDTECWWLNKYLPFDHIAGEHRYIFATKSMGPKRNS